MSSVSLNDVKIIKEDGFTVQHDWHQSFNAGKDKFFVNYKKYGEQSMFYDFKCEAGRVKLDEDSKLFAERQGSKLHVKLDNDASRLFVAPNTYYENIHKGSIYSVDISPTENLCVSSDSTGQLLVWETTYGNKVRDLEGAIMDTYKARFFPSGLVVLTAGMDMTVRIFSVENGWNARTMIGHKAAVHDIGVIEEGQNVVSCSKDGTLKMWNCSEGKVLQEWNPEAGSLNALALSDYDLNLIGVAAEFQKALVYDMRSTDIAFQCDTQGSSTSICFDSGLHLYVGSCQGFVNVYDLRMKKLQMVIETQRGRVNRLLHNGVIGLVGAFNDGTLASYHDDSLFSMGKPTVEFTGSDCDPIYDISIGTSSMISACRDKVFRKYNFES